MNMWQNIFYALLSGIGIVLTIRFFLFFFLGCKEKYSSRQIISQFSDNSLFFSILIPAREESRVITKTLQEVLRISYPIDRQEILIITDQKETHREGVASTRRVLESWIKENYPNMRYSSGDNQSTFKGDSTPPIWIYDVPSTYNGKIPGSTTNQPVPSSKGRALNYALSTHSFTKPYQYCTFFDAETHPDASIFFTIDQMTSKTEQLPIWQGPALQVRNFAQLSLFCKIAALTQAFSHDYTLPSLLHWIPFLGGTNMHIPYAILSSIGGFRSDCATEDIDAGIRIWDQCNQLPQFLPVACTEQTPASLKGYFNQRLRWGKGIIDVLLNSDHPSVHAKSKRVWMLWKVFFFGPFEWYLYGILSLFYLVHTFQRFLFAFSADIVAYFLFLGISVLFLFSLYIYYRKYMQYKVLTQKEIIQGVWLVLYILLVLPWISFLYGLPFIWGSVLSIIQLKKPTPQTSHKEFWMKTPRTTEK
jgi:cellulose synthase/poly-beta-1,6-N-acetylglucosamine synthase-like glycosyltransferase